MAQYTQRLGLYLPSRLDDDLDVDISLAKSFQAIEDKLGSGLVDENGNVLPNLFERLKRFEDETPEKYGATETGNSTQAFSDLENNVSGAVISLRGRTYTVDELPDNNIYVNGSFKIGTETFTNFNTFAFANNTNVFLGKGAGKNADPLSDYLKAGGNYSNVGIGFEALTNNGRGWRNTAVGWSAMRDNIEGQNNAAFGDSALERNIGAPNPDGGLALGSRNTAFGSYALRYNVTGIGNVGIGRNAGHANESGDYNTAVGTNAYSGSVSEGGAQDRKHAHFNTAVGYNALFNTEASDNTGVGSHAGYNNTGGRFNTFIGNSAARALLNGNRNVALGYSALLENEGSDNTAVGTNALGNMKNANSSVAIGDNALMFDIAGNPLLAGNYVTGIGKQTRVSGDNQIQLGTSGQTTYAYGAIQNRSDARDKTDIRDTELGLDFIMGLRPVDFKWNYRDDYVEFYEENEDVTTLQTIEEIITDENGDEQKIERDVYVTEKQSVTKTRVVENDGSKKRSRFHHGIIAQELKETLDEKNIDFGGYQDHSKNGGADVLSVGYEEFIGPLIKAFQEQQQQIITLQEEVKALKGDK